MVGTSGPYDEVFRVFKMFFYPGETVRHLPSGQSGCVTYPDKIHKVHVMVIIHGRPLPCYPLSLAKRVI